MMAAIEGLTQGPGRRRVERAPLGRFLPHAVALTAKGSQWDPCSDPWSSQAFNPGGIGEEGRREGGQLPLPGRQVFSVSGRGDGQPKSSPATASSQPWK